MQFHRVLKPGGKVAFSTFNTQCDYFQWIREIYASSLSVDKPETEKLLSYPMQTLGVESGLRKVLRAAGFEQVKTQKVRSDFVYQDKWELWSSLWSYGTREVLEKLSEKQRKKFRENLFDRANVLKNSSGIPIPPIEVLLASGTRTPC
jgi:hypothetical protein